MLCYELQTLELTRKMPVKPSSNLPQATYCADPVVMPQIERFEFVCYDRESLIHRAVRLASKFGVSLGLSKNSPGCEVKLRCAVDRCPFYLKYRKDEEIFALLERYSDHNHQINQIA